MTIRMIGHKCSLGCITQEILFEDLESNTLIAGEMFLYSQFDTEILSVIIEYSSYRSDGNCVILIRITQVKVCSDFVIGHGIDAPLDLV